MFAKIPSNVTLAGLSDYVKNRKGEYDYQDQGNCAFAQYLKSLGYECFVSYSGFRARKTGEDLWLCYEFKDLHPGLPVALVCPPRQNTWTSLFKRINALN